MTKPFETFFDNLTSPVTGAEGVRQIVCLILIFIPQALTTAESVIVIASISGILSLFTRSSTVSTKRVDQKVDELVLHRELAGTSGTGDGMSPGKAPPSVVS